MSALKQLSWTPIRRGPFYCSPACGARCTILQYDKAWMAANALAKRLGEGWKPVVHENMNWYASVISATGHWKVHIHTYPEGDSYTAFLGEPDCGGGKWAETADTPEAAIRKVQRAARAYLKRFETWPIDIKLPKRIRGN